MLEPFGEVSTKSPIQLASRTHFDTIFHKKKLSPKINKGLVLVRPTKKGNCHEMTENIDWDVKHHLKPRCCRYPTNFCPVNIVYCIFKCTLEEVLSWEQMAGSSLISVHIVCNIG